jgi:hypothetical protein
MTRRLRTTQARIRAFANLRAPLRRDFSCRRGERPEAPGHCLSFTVSFVMMVRQTLGMKTVELEPDDRTRAELLADAAMAKDQAARFKRAADMIDDDLVQSAKMSPD